MPYPFGEREVATWIGAFQEKRRGDVLMGWAIRAEDGLLIGDAGVVYAGRGRTHRATLGAWLARPYWGRGIMSAAVEQICAVAFGQLDVVRLEATTLASNAAAARVLEKCGFRLEGVLRKYYARDGGFRDAKLYARVS